MAIAGIVVLALFGIKMFVKSEVEELISNAYFPTDIDTQEPDVVFGTYPLPDMENDIIPLPNVVNDTLPLPNVVNDTLPFPEVVDDIFPLLKQGVCDSETCYTALDDMLAWMSTASHDPCDNFYDFACKGWEKQNKRPNYTVGWSVLQKLLDTTNKEIIAILQDSDGSYDDPSQLQQARRYFNNCMSDVTSSTDDMSDVLNDYGGWPLLYPRGTWNSSRFNWMKTLVDLKRRFNVGIILDVTSFQHPQGNVSDNRIILKPASVFNRERKGIFSQGKVHSHDKPLHTNLSHPAVMEFIVDVSRELLLFKGETNLNQTYLEEKAASIIHVQEKLLQVTAKRAVSRSQPLSGDMTLSKLQSLIDAHFQQQGLSSDNMSLQKLLTLLYSGTGVNITADELVHVSDIDYVLEVSTFVASLTPEELANFLHFHMAVELASLTTPKMQGYVNKVKGRLYGEIPAQPQNMVCLKRAKSQYNDMLGYAYVKSKYPDPQTALAIVNETTEIFNSLKQLLKDEVSISNSRYFIPADIDYKTDKTGLCAGFNPEWISGDNPFQTDDYYDESNYDYGWGHDKDDKYLYQHLAGNARTVDKQLKLLRTEKGQPDLKYKYKESSSYSYFSFDCMWAIFAGGIDALNGGGTLDSNVHIPMGIMQAPFYSPSFPSAMNYAGLGYVLGHELAHSLGSSGWTTLASGILNPNADCFARQYDTFSPMLPGEIYLDGRLTLDENISDNVGLLLAYKLYKTVQAKGEEMPIPGLWQYTNDQIFFLSIAQNWCESNTADELNWSLESDTHSPGKFRVLGPLMNSKEFASAWNCPVGSKMNPAEDKKCSMF